MANCALCFALSWNRASEFFVSLKCYQRFFFFCAILISISVLLPFRFQFRCFWRVEFHFRLSAHISILEVNWKIVIEFVRVFHIWNAPYTIRNNRNYSRCQPGTQNAIIQSFPFSSVPRKKSLQHFHYYRQHQSITRGWLTNLRTLKCILTAHSILHYYFQYFMRQNAICLFGAFTNLHWTGLKIEKLHTFFFVNGTAPEVIIGGNKWKHTHTI